MIWGWWAFCAALWYLVSAHTTISELILPHPAQVWSCFMEHHQWVLRQVGHTLKAMMLGSCTAIGLGILCSVIMVSCERLARLFLPLFALLQSIPVLVLAPLLMLWMGFGWGMRLTVLVLMVLFPIIQLCYDGLWQIPEEWLELAELNHSSWWKTLRWIRIPHALPSLGAALRLVSTMIPIGVIATEWMGDEAGLGVMMLQANARMSTEWLFVGVVWLLLISGLWYSVTHYLASYWQEHYQ